MPNPDVINYQYNGVVYHIPADREQAFLRAAPGATVVRPDNSVTPTTDMGPIPGSKKVDRKPISTLADAVDQDHEDFERDITRAATLNYVMTHKPSLEDVKNVNDGVKPKTDFDKTMQDLKGGGDYVSNSVIKGVTNVLAGAANQLNAMMANAPVQSYQPLGGNGISGQDWTDFVKKQEAEDQAMGQRNAAAIQGARGKVNDALMTPGHEQLEKDVEGAKGIGGTIARTAGGFAEFMPQMLAAAPTGGASLYFGGYQSGLDQVKDNKNMPDGLKPLYGMAMGTVNAALMSLPIARTLDKALLNKAIGKVAMSALAKVVKDGGDKLTGDAFMKILNDATQSAVNKVKIGGVKAAKSLAEGVAFSTAQQGAELGTQKLFNAGEGKQVFETPDFKQMAESVASNSLALAMFGYGSGVLRGNAENYIKTKIADAKTPEDIQAIHDQVDNMAQSGRLNQSQAQELKNSVNAYSEIKKTLPATMSPAQQAQAFDLIKDRDAMKAHLSDLQQQLQADQNVPEESLRGANSKRLQDEIRHTQLAIEARNDQIREAATGLKYKYGKENGEAYKQLGPNGEKEPVSEDLYELQNLNEKAAKESEQAQDIHTPQTPETTQTPKTPASETADVPIAEEPTPNPEPTKTEDNATIKSTQQQSESDQPAGVEEHPGTSPSRDETQEPTADNSNSGENSQGAEFQIERDETGKVTAIKDKDGADIPEFNETTREVKKKGLVKKQTVKTRNPEYDRAIRHAAENTDFNQGKRVNPDNLPPELGEHEVEDWAAHESQNPAELAAIHARATANVESASKQQILDEIENTGVTDPRVQALKYFAEGGRVNTKEVERIYGNKKKSVNSEHQAHIGLVKGDAPSIEKVADGIWRQLSSKREISETDQDYRNALIDAFQEINSSGGAMQKLRETYSPGAKANALARIEAARKFEEITGLPLTDDVADIAMRQNVEPERLSKSEDRATNTEPTEEEKDYILRQELPKFDDSYDKFREQWDNETAETLKGQPGQGPEVRSPDGEPEVGGSENPVRQESKGGSSQGSGAGDKGDKDRQPETESRSTRLAAAEKRLRSAQKALSDAEAKVSATRGEQGDMFKPAQKGLFPATGEESKAILDPLRNEVKDAKAQVDKIRQGQDVDDRQGDLFESSAQKKHYEEVAGSRPNPNTGRIPVDPIVGGAVKKVDRIIADFAKATGTKIRFMRSRRTRSLGSYNSTDAGIKIRYEGDLDVTAHEVGHKLDDKFGIIKDVVDNPGHEAEKELLEFAKHGSTPPTGHPDPRKYELGEGLAEWLRAYVANPGEAIAKGPSIHDLYEQKVSERLKMAVTDFSNDFRAYAGLSAIDQSSASLHMEPDKRKGLMKQIFDKAASNEGFSVNWVDRLAMNWVYPLQAFKKASEYLQEINGLEKPMSGNDPESLARVFLSVDRKFGEFLEHGIFDPKDEPMLSSDRHVMNLGWLLEPLDNTDVSTIKKEAELTAIYMISERVPELIKKFDRESVINGFGAGIYSEPDVAMRVMKEFNNGDPLRLARIKEAARRYREFSDANLRYLLESGRISKDQYDKIKENNLYYVAMNRLKQASPSEELVVVAPSKQSGKLGIVYDPIKKIKGSMKPVMNPYISVLDNLHKGIREADRNRVLQAFRELMVNDREMYDGEPIPVANIATRGNPGDLNSITIFVDGKPETWVFQKDIYEGLKGLDGDGYRLPGVFTVLPKILRNSVTRFPVFGARNLWKDSWDRVMKSTTGSGFKDLVGDKGHWREVARLGGLNSGYYVKDAAHYYGLLEESMHKLSKSKNTIVVNGDVFKRAWHGYENILEKSETANRVAEYRSAYRKAINELGYDEYNAKVYAAVHARDLMDFAVMGRYMKILNQVVPFSNAAVQGLRSSYMSFKTNPAKFMARTAIYSVMPQVTLWLWNHRSKEAAKEYEALPDYQRDMYWNVYIGPNKWASMPKPYELGMMASAVDRGLSKTTGNNKEAFDGYAGQVLESLSPVGDIGAVAGPYAPLVEYSSNKNFFTKKNIIPDYEEPLDMSLRHTDYASRLGKAIQKTSGLFGENAEMDPRKADFLVRSLFSYYGNFAVKLSDIGRADKTSNSFGLPDLGFFRTSPAYNSKPVQEMVEYAGKYRKNGTKAYRAFLSLKNMYFQSESDKEREILGKQMIDMAKKLMSEWQNEAPEPSGISHTPKHRKIVKK